MRLKLCDGETTGYAVIDLLEPHLSKVASVGRRLRCSEFGFCRFIHDERDSMGLSSVLSKFLVEHAIDRMFAPVFPLST